MRSFHDGKCSLFYLLRFSTLFLHAMIEAVICNAVAAAFYMNTSIRLPPLAPQDRTRFNLWVTQALS